MILERPMTAKGVADALGISKATVLNCAHSKTKPLAHIRIGNRYRFFWSDIVKYFDIPADKVVSSATQPTGTPPASIGVLHE